MASSSTSIFSGSCCPFICWTLDVEAPGVSKTFWLEVEEDGLNNELPRAEPLELNKEATMVSSCY